ncbi:hypothetical protein DFJ77DRAFT_83527 [Powellomyces hirtus]|nr:hypothetical protein DFJ77DRAFT_83527 [Powellomyces hirtus]
MAQPWEQTKGGKRVVVWIRPTLGERSWQKTHSNFPHRPSIYYSEQSTLESTPPPPPHPAAGPATSYLSRSDIPQGKTRRINKRARLLPPSTSWAYRSSSLVVRVMNRRSQAAIYNDKENNEHLDSVLFASSKAATAGVMDRTSKLTREEQLLQWKVSHCYTCPFRKSCTNHSDPNLCLSLICAPFVLSTASASWRSFQSAVRQSSIAKSESERGKGQVHAKQNQRGKECVVQNVKGGNKEYKGH